MVVSEQETYYFNMKYLKRCHDDCEMFIARYKDKSIHHAQLRCKEHGWIKWISKSQADELADLIESLNKS